MSVEVKNLDSFNASVMGWFAAVEKAAAEAAVGLAHTAFNHILYVSPQNSGDFVANWKIQAGRITPSFQENAIGGRDSIQSLMGAGKYQRGDERAIQHAKSRNAGALAGFKLGGSIYIHNSAAHDEPYAMKIEDGLISFRPANVGSDAVARRGAAYTANRYKYIGGAQLQALRRAGV